MMKTHYEIILFIFFVFFSNLSQVITHYCVVEDLSMLLQLTSDFIENFIEMFPVYYIHNVV